ncbi:MAG: hypothetical protein CVU05_13645 [Bacteroidetes bacterium HGW-Bacteroidetes-21]|nr:MAG: hypothetical protein CVU05_13645 [Bacteroidetes bacterium HGW-Bacteroidetes-21]
MNKKKLVLFVPAFVLLFSLTYCSKKSQVFNQVRLPGFDNIDVEYNKFVVDAGSSTTLKIPGGTNIVIPSNAFVDENGNPVTGDVDISYREFQDAADIIISGMPMSYDSAGKVNSFETAGMFEINGFKDGKPIFVAKDKSLQVNFASNTSSGNFNFYEFDSTSNNWSFTTGNIETRINPVRDSLQKQIGKEPNKPILPQIVTSETKVLDLNINFDLYPELKSMEGLMWTYAGTDSKNNPDNNKWIYKVNWSSIQLNPFNEESNQYELVLKSAKTEFRTIITPVLSQLHFDQSKKNFDEKMNAYLQVKKGIENQKMLAERENEFMRSFSVSGFGLYNCDRIYSRPSMITLNAEFKIDGKGIDFNTCKTLIHVSANSKAVIRYNASNIKTFVIDPLDDNLFIAILNDNKVAMLERNEVSSLNLKRFIEGGGEKSAINFSFNLKTRIESIKSEEDIRKLIATI